MRSFGDAKGLAFSRDGKLLAVGVQDAVHIHDWPSLVHKASIRFALHAVLRCEHPYHAGLALRAGLVL